MKNLFDKDTYNEITARLNALTPLAERKWGKMNAAQMLAHCNEPFKISMSDKKIPRPFVSYLFGWVARRMVLAEKPYKPGLPTAKELIIKDERDFETEKKKLGSLMEAFIVNRRKWVSTRILFLANSPKPNGVRACTSTWITTCCSLAHS
jgi:hypothetical protein